MTHSIVLGMQWGDEGKGKIVDLICPSFDAVVRYQGGHNAGHTVKFGDRHFALHLLPSGIFHDGMSCVLGNGMVIDPDALFEEIDQLRPAVGDLDRRLVISDRAHVILPTHLALDRAREESRGRRKIGTTVRGIGPAYESKAARHGVRTGDLGAADLEDRLAVQHRAIAAQLVDLGVAVPDLGEMVATCRAWGKRLKRYLRETATLLHDWTDEGRSVLFEGAQGALLDVDHGTYPFVTSSNATAGGVCTGTGVPPTRIGGALGVIKAYTTRVGAGPFVGELHDEVGEHLRRRGNEFGTTTGRPRRCGWLDAVAARHSRRLNGVDALAVTKLDVLDELDEIRICIGYRHRGTVDRSFPASLVQLDEAEPVFRTVPGWKQPTAGRLEIEDLPRQARDYLAILEDEIGAPAALISTGPRREETIVVEGTETRRVLGDVDVVIAHRDGDGEAGRP